MAYMDMRLPTLSKWQPSDARPVKTGAQHKLSAQALHASLKRLKGMQNGGRMSARSILQAVGSTDRNIYDYLKRLVERGHLKRETLRAHYVYFLSAPQVNKKAEQRAKAKQARIAKLRREIKKKQTALRNLGC